MEKYPKFYAYHHDLVSVHSATHSLNWADIQNSFDMTIVSLNTLDVTRGVHVFVVVVDWI